MEKRDVSIAAGIEALRQEYRDSRLIQRVEDEQKFLTDTT